MTQDKKRSCWKSQSPVTEVQGQLLPSTFDNLHKSHLDTNSCRTLLAESYPTAFRLRNFITYRAHGQFFLDTV